MGNLSKVKIKGKKVVLILFQVLEQNLGGKYVYYYQGLNLVPMD